MLAKVTFFINFSDSHSADKVLLNGHKHPKSPLSLTEQSACRSLQNRHYSRLGVFSGFLPHREPGAL
jgi:hypothetical protein